MANFFSFSSFVCVLFSLTFSLQTLDSRLLAQGPDIKSCPSDGVKQFLIQNDPAYKSSQELYERDYQAWSNAKRGNLQTVSTLPIVVHIFHGGQPLGSNENPTDQQIQEVIAEANQRFRHTHPGAGNYSNPLYGVDTEIEMCISGVDPSGNATTGILRYNIPALSEGTYSELYPLLNAYKWDITKYMNLFIVAELQNAGGVYIGGSYDFTIYNSGSFWSGLVVHEQGHYFSLNHTFNTGNCVNNNCLVDGDKVCDTPPKAMSGMQGGTCANPNNTCTTDDDDLSPNNPYRPVSMGGLGDQPDMLANYMDYTFNCWDAFTAGQSDRMAFNILNSRASVVAHAEIACGGTQEVLGCTDPNAHNFNPQATQDDGSCETCADGIQNGDEQGVDCGGQLCVACPSECVIQGYTLTYWDDWCPFSGTSVNIQGPAGQLYWLTNPYWGNGILYGYNEDVPVGITDPDMSYVQWEAIDQNDPNCSISFTVYNICEEEDESGCTDPLGHNYDPNAVDDDGSCETCIDGLRNGDETGVDCGGAFCGPCLPNCGVNVNIETIQCTGQGVTFDFHLTTTEFSDVFTTWQEDPNNAAVRQQLQFVLLNENFPNPSIGRVTFPLGYSKYTLVMFYFTPPGQRYCFDTIVLDNPCDNPVLGCTDSNAHNYNPAAQEDDGSCETCFDGKLNGDEEGVDCGGSICAPCPQVGVNYSLPHIVYMCPGDSVLITVKVTSGKPPYTYQWTSAAGQFITDFESVWIHQPGNYTVCVSTANHSTTCLMFEVVSSVVGCIDATAGNNQVEVAFPNGFTGKDGTDLRIEGRHTEASESKLKVFPVPVPSGAGVNVILPTEGWKEFLYTVYDLNGKPVATGQAASEGRLLSVPLPHLLAGTYVIRLQSDEVYVVQVLVL